jgi:peroxiredoxin
MSNWRSGVIVFAALLVAGCATNKNAQEIEGVDADGAHFKLSDYRGKVVLLDFWRTN